MSDLREQLVKERAERRKNSEAITSSHVSSVVMDMPAKFAKTVFNGSRPGKLRNIKIYTHELAQDVQGSVHIYVYNDFESSPKVYTKTFKDYIYFNPIKVEGKPCIVKVVTDLTNSINLAFEATYDFK